MRSRREDNRVLLHDASGIAIRWVRKEVVVTASPSFCARARPTLWHKPPQVPVLYKCCLAVHLRVRCLSLSTASELEIRLNLTFAQQFTTVFSFLSLIERYASDVMRETPLADHVRAQVKLKSLSLGEGRHWKHGVMFALHCTHSEMVG